MRIATKTQTTTSITTTAITTATTNTTAASAVATMKMMLMTLRKPVMSCLLCTAAPAEAVALGRGSSGSPCTARAAWQVEAAETEPKRHDVERVGDVSHEPKATVQPHSLGQGASTENTHKPETLNPKPESGVGAVSQIHPGRRLRRSEIESWQEEQKSEHLRACFPLFMIDLP